MDLYNPKTILLLIPIILAIIAYVVYKTITKLKRKRAEELFANYHKDRIIYFSKKVNYFGRESAGRAQIRGNGSLLLTPDKLHFLRWLPKKDIIISLENVENIERVNSFLGKGRKDDLLKIEFNNQNGNNDSAAWFLNNMHAWEEVIKDNLN